MTTHDPLEPRRDLYAWVTLMPDGRWTLVGFIGPSGVHHALLSHSRVMVESTREIALGHGRATGQPVELVRWHAIETLEHIEP